jgi:hypothetical protein
MKDFFKTREEEEEEISGLLGKQDDNADAGDHPTKKRGSAKP